MNRIAVGLLATLGVCGAAVLTPDNIGAPFATQPFAGLQVTGGVTEPFYSDLSGLTFPGPGVVTLLGNLHAVDSGGNPISSFQLLGVQVTQGASTLTPPLEDFVTASPVTYYSTLGSSSVTISPGELNKGFVFNSDSSFVYSYALTVSGIPNGGFLLYNDVEGAQTPEPASWSLVALGAGCALRRLARRRSG